MIKSMKSSMVLIKSVNEGINYEFEIAITTYVPIELNNSIKSRISFHVGTHKPFNLMFVFFVILCCLRELEQYSFIIYNTINEEACFKSCLYQRFKKTELKISSRTYSK